MARGRKLETLEHFKRALKNGYGLGKGSNYKPWFRVQDVPSRGQSAKIRGIKTQRTHHTLSLSETQLFYISEFSDNVVDIREQFPLIPLSLSVKIAKEIGVEHPRIPHTGQLNVITTDFLLTCIKSGQTSYIAFNVKPEDEVNNLRVLEKVDIENQWWKLLGVDFKEFVPNELTRIQSANISWFTHPVRHMVGNINSFDDRLKLAAIKMLDVGFHSQEDICERFISELQLDHVNAPNLLKVLLAEKRITADLSLPISTSGVISIESISSISRGAANER